MESQSTKKPFGTPSFWPQGIAAAQAADWTRGAVMGLVHAWPNEKKMYIPYISFLERVYHCVPIQIPRDALTSKSADILDPLALKFGPAVI